MIGMTRYGSMYGPDYTFLGVPACNWQEPETYADADVVIIGAPFDGGTSHRPGRPLRPERHPRHRLPRRTTDPARTWRCGWTR